MSKRKKDRSKQREQFKRKAQNKAHLEKLGYTVEVNGIKFEDLTGLAFRKLIEQLESYGNVVSTKQQEALYELLGRYTKITQKLSQGRYAFPLSTGLGKTQSVVAWIAAVHELGLEHVSVAVCQSKVEALCTLKRDLIDAGVPAEKIGLLHTYKHDPVKAGEKGFASLPSTDENDTRPYLLCTHNRVMGKGGVEQFNQFNGKDRDLLIWDESLMKSEGRSLTALVMERALGGYEPVLRRMTSKPAAMECAQYLQDALTTFIDELEAQKVNLDRCPVPIELPQLSGATLNHYKSLLGESMATLPLRQLLDMSQQGELRVVYTGQSDGGFIQYDLVVPTELENIIILDASYPIRELMKLDETVQGVGAASLGVVHYQNVTIHQLRSNSGREAIREQLSGSKEKRNVCREIVDVVKAIPDDEGVILFSFKARDYNGKSFDFENVLKADLEAAGVDLDATLSHNGKNRFVWLTWGNETSLSQYSYCSNVILVGVLHRSFVDLSASIVGQSEDLFTEITNSDLKTVMQGELAHCVYQAISRGRCRTLNGEYANPTQSWIIHPHLSIRERINEVMPGVRWKTWTPQYLESAGKIEKAATKIVKFLEGFDQVKVSSVALKRDTGLVELPQQTFKKARDLAMSELNGDWEVSGRSIQRCLDFPMCTI